MNKKLIISLLAFSFILFNGCKKNPVVPAAALPAPLAAPSYPLSVVFEDCEDNDNVDNFGGFWFTYDDTKAPNFGKSVVYPRNGALYTMARVGPDWDSVHYGPNIYAAEMTGTVYEWKKPYVAFIGEGIQMGPTENQTNLYNFTGMSFWAKVGPTDQIHTAGPYRIALKTPITINPDMTLYDYYGYTFTPSTTWTQYNVTFASDFVLAFSATPPPQYQPGGSIGGGEPQYRIDSMKNVTDIQIQTDNPIPQTPDPTVSFNVDFWIDNIVLYRN